MYSLQVRSPKIKLLAGSTPWTGSRREFISFPRVSKGCLHSLARRSSQHLLSLTLTSCFLLMKMFGNSMGALWILQDNQPSQFITSKKSLLRCKVPDLQVPGIRIEASLGNIIWAITRKITNESKSQVNMYSTLVPSFFFQRNSFHRCNSIPFYMYTELFIEFQASKISKIIYISMNGEFFKSCYIFKLEYYAPM